MFSHLTVSDPCSSSLFSRLCVLSHDPSRAHIVERDAHAISSGWGCPTRIALSLQPGEVKHSTSTAFRISTFRPSYVKDRHSGVRSEPQRLAQRIRAVARKRRNMRLMRYSCTSCTSKRPDIQGTNCDAVGSHAFSDTLDAQLNESAA